MKKLNQNGVIHHLQLIVLAVVVVGVVGVAGWQVYRNNIGAQAASGWTQWGPNNGSLQADTHYACQIRVAGVLRIYFKMRAGAYERSWFQVEDRTDYDNKRALARATVKVPPYKTSAIYYANNVNSAVKIVGMRNDRSATTGMNISSLQTCTKAY